MVYAWHGSPSRGRESRRGGFRNVARPRGCAAPEARARRDAPGVSVGAVEMGRAEVDFDERVTSADAVVAAVVDAGYPASHRPAG